MGYLTHMSLYNDGLHLLKQMAEEDGAKARKFCLDLYYASLKAHREAKDQDVSVNYFCNFATVQAPVHADDWNLYLNYGNCLIDMNLYRNKDRYSMELWENVIKRSELIVKDLKKQLKKMKEKNDE